MTTDAHEAGTAGTQYTQPAPGDDSTSVPDRHRQWTEVISDDAGKPGPSLAEAVGLGIDAGGTYTDAVIYDWGQGRTRCKHKALTTKWDFTLGIGQALDGLDAAQLRQADLVAVSTTLATNAIVEGDGQKVGMLLMPPYGRYAPGEIPYTPQAVVSGQLDISGKELVPVDADEVRRTIQRMTETDGVGAFAVSGFGGTINPAHERAVKRIIQEETGLWVSCGHELSAILDFKVRAVTAMFNARIIPGLARFLRDLETVLRDRGIRAPVAVVKGDGTLMRAELARERPVETILSGPAASVAGARRLTGLDDALVVDMGGTTTDTALLTEGRVSLCESGATVAGRKTHVRALEIRTAGLGGDSLILYEKDDFVIGPKRVAPVCWLGETEASAVVAYLRHHHRRFTTSTRSMQVLALTGAAVDFPLTQGEGAVMEVLRSGPASISELTEKIGVLTDTFLPLQRLEDRHLVQRYGLTPTDLLHVTGQFRRWHAATARQFAGLMAKQARMSLDDLATLLLKRVSEALAVELLKRQLDEELDPDPLNDCDLCRAFVNNWLSGGGDWSVRMTLKRPVVGIGAPVALFLPRSAELLGTEAVLPVDADVANAVGAVTSIVTVTREVCIVPEGGAGFRIEGVVDAPGFKELAAADAFARETLVSSVRASGRAAGTGERTVTLTFEDRVPKAAGGRGIFLGRCIRAVLSGPPDAILAAEAG